MKTDHLILNPTDGKGGGVCGGVGNTPLSAYLAAITSGRCAGQEERDVQIALGEQEAKGLSARNRTDMSLAAFPQAQISHCTPSK